MAADYPGIAETMRIGDTHPDRGGHAEAVPRGKGGPQVFLCYTEFISTSAAGARSCLKLLPAHFDAADKQPAGAHVLTEDDPSPESVFDAVIPEYLYGVLYGAVVESYCSEQSARRMAMEAASDNAGEMIENLNLSLQPCASGSDHAGNYGDRSRLGRGRSLIESGDRRVESGDTSRLFTLNSALFTLFTEGSFANE